MLVLGIERSTTQGGVAILDEGHVLCETILNVEVTHSERLLPTMDRALGEARISLEALGGIAVSIGPGSFTGLRSASAPPRAWRMPRDSRSSACRRWRRWPGRSPRPDGRSARCWTRASRKCMRRSSGTSRKGCGESRTIGAGAGGPLPPDPEPYAVSR